MIQLQDHVIQLHDHVIEWLEDYQSDHMIHVDQKVLLITTNTQYKMMMIWLLSYLNRFI